MRIQLKLAIGVGLFALSWQYLRGTPALISWIPQNTKDQCIIMVIMVWLGIVTIFHSLYILPIDPKWINRQHMPFGLHPNSVISRVLSLWAFAIYKQRVLPTGIENGFPHAKENGSYKPAQWRARLMERWRSCGGSATPGGLRRAVIGNWKQGLASGILLTNVVAIPIKLADLAQPLVLTWVFSFAENQEPLSEGARILVFVLLLQFLATWSEKACQLIFNVREYMPFKIAMQTLVLKKLHKLDAKGWSQTNLGEVQMLRCVRVCVRVIVCECVSVPPPIHPPTHTHTHTQTTHRQWVRQIHYFKSHLPHRCTDRHPVGGACTILLHHFTPCRFIRGRGRCMRVHGRGNLRPTMRSATSNASEPDLGKATADARPTHRVLSNLDYVRLDRLFRGSGP